LLQCASENVLNLCSNRFEKALLLNSNNDAKLRTVRSQEGENGIECLHIKFTLAEDVFESRMTQKQGENVEYMFELRTTQMQEGENDDDITNTWIGDQIQVLPPLSQGHHITCGIRKQGDQV
jgi:hypothetical protein